jgi:hypothetical protein
MRMRRSTARARRHAAVEAAPIDPRSYVPWMAILSPPRQPAGRLGRESEASDRGRRSRLSDAHGHAPDDVKPGPKDEFAGGEVQDEVKARTAIAQAAAPGVDPGERPVRHVCRHNPEPPATLANDGDRLSRPEFGPLVEAGDHGSTWRRVENELMARRRVENEVPLRVGAYLRSHRRNGTWCECHASVRAA